MWWNTDNSYEKNNKLLGVDDGFIIETKKEEPIVNTEKFVVETIPTDNIYMKKINFKAQITGLLYLYINSNNVQVPFIADRILQSVDYENQLISSNSKVLSQCIRLEIYRYTGINVQLNQIINICKNYY